MPFPSSGCQVCRSRHIKCDETRPTCLNCRKSGRQCAGWRASTGSLLFLNENIYASTQMRRPRGGARWVPEFSVDDLSAVAVTNDGRLSSPATASDTIIPQLSEVDDLAPPSGGEVSTWIPPNLQQPIDDVAIGYFAHTYFHQTNVSPEYMWSLISHKFQHSSQLGGDDALNLSFSALSLVYYGRNNGVLAAMIEGRKKYSRALRHIRNAIENRHRALTDEILIAVMIMASYENNVANFDPQKLLSLSFQHHSGAISLLKIRQEYRTGKCPPTSLDQCIRRQVIKSCVYRHIPVPDWLQDGSAFGEADYQLELDQCFVKLASLRHQVATIFYDSDDVPQLQVANAKPLVETLIADAIDIFHSLNMWRATLEPRYHYEVVYGDLADPSSSVAALFYSTQIYSFHDAENASLWTRYHGVRLFVASMLTKLLFFWRHVCGDDPEKYSATEQMVQADAYATANDICADIPFAFGVDFNTQKDLETVVEETTPGAVMSLNWPMIILAGSLTSDEMQRQWAKDKMMLVSKITGNGTIQTLANMKIQQHSRVRPGALLEQKEKRR